MSDIASAELTCASCARTVDHELHYSGRLLHSTRCTACDHLTEVEPRVLVPAYLLDLEQRVVSKPRRLLRQAVREPSTFLLGLPLAVVRQPVKIARELRSLFRG